MTQQFVRFFDDAVNVAALPSGLSAYAGYVDGKWVTVPALRARFPQATIITITVTGLGGYHVVDCETGNLTPVQAAHWAADELLAHRAWRPTIYCNESTQPEVIKWLTVLGITGQIDIWQAHYDNIAVVPAGCVAKQYSSTAYDANICLDTWSIFSQTKPMEGVDMPLFVRFPTKGGKYPQGLVAECSGGVATNLASNWPNVEAAYGGNPPITEDPNGSLLDSYPVHHGF